MSNKKLKVTAIGDLHIGRLTVKPFTELFSELNQKSDVLVLCGDLTNRGTIDEAKKLVEELSILTIPVVTVLGNHDFEHGKQKEIQKILTDAKIYVLDEEPKEISGVGFAGVKGFAGGFNEYMLGAFGESFIKAFVSESINEALKLENQLASLTTDRKVVVLHYSPIAETLKGEPEQIYPFLGSSRLVETIDRFSVSAVFHGHAHNGVYQGKTLKNVPVYNVAFDLLQKHSPKNPYALIEI